MSENQSAPTPLPKGNRASITVPMPRVQPLFTLSPISVPKPPMSVSCVTPPSPMPETCSSRPSGLMLPPDPKPRTLDQSVPTAGQTRIVVPNRKSSESAYESISVEQSPTEPIQQTAPIRSSGSSDRSGFRGRGHHAGTDYRKDMYSALKHQILPGLQHGIQELVRGINKESVDVNYHMNALHYYTGVAERVRRDMVYYSYAGRRRAHESARGRSPTRDCEHSGSRSRSRGSR
jgi:hypothetical protein